MGWRLFGGDGWPADPRLDPFREAVWQLSHDGEVVGHLVSRVGRMRSFPVSWVRQEQTWFGIAWSDGARERYQEDYGPQWHTVGELEQGFFEDTDRGGRLVAEQLHGQERDVIWQR